MAAGHVTMEATLPAQQNSHERETVVRLQQVIPAFLLIACSSKHRACKTYLGEPQALCYCRLQVSKTIPQRVQQG